MVKKQFLLTFIVCLFCCSIFGSIEPAIRANNNKIDIEDKLPLPQVHPLPENLERWQDTSNSGDYFDRIAATKLGYLIWSHFPISIYLDKPAPTQNPTAAEIRFQKWFESAQKGIAEWNEYLPLAEVTEAETADIIVMRKQPEIEPEFDRATGKFTIPRARSAQTSYKLYLDSQNTLDRRITLEISPNLNDSATMSAVRHELGHALGIWGHSPTETDVMFFSQVRNAPSISSRDINTLKKIYQQPTRLGWRLRE
jgi:predicted Zn-dependent protease